MDDELLQIRMTALPSRHIMHTLLCDGFIVVWFLGDRL